MSVVTVIIPTHDRPEYLRESLASVRAQTFADVDIIVVDDASATPVTATLSPADLAGVRVLRHEVNRGAGESRRTGVAAAISEFVAFLDDDDLWAPTLLETAVAVLRRDPSIGLFCCDGRLVDAAGHPLPSIGTFNNVQAALHGFAHRTGPRSLEDVFLWPTVGIGFVVRRDVLARAPYPADRFLEDYRFQLDVAGHGSRVYYHHEPLASYRMHAANTSAANPLLCREMVRCLEDAMRRFPQLHKLGAAGRRRLAQAHMDLAVASFREGRAGDGVAALGAAVAAHPAQALTLIDLGRRWVMKRAGVVPRHA